VMVLQALRCRNGDADRERPAPAAKLMAAQGKTVKKGRF